MSDETFPCYLVSKEGDTIRGEIAESTKSDLPAGDVLIEVEYSSLNYKDALSATGHPGVVRKFPHVPGIDAVGTVVESSSEAFQSGAPVLVTGYDLGSGCWGGWSRFIRVPADWIVPLPAGLSAEEAMTYGTAGFTAAMSVQSLLNHGVLPELGEVVVTGATGGVGMTAVMLLAQLGYQVVAVTGKSERHDLLKQMGATEVVSREAVNDSSERPLLSSRWVGAVDTVGGNTLATLLRSTKLGGCVTACGLVGGTKLAMTVHPFILRGVTLSGIDSAWFPHERRVALWEKLAGDWKLDQLKEVSTTVSLQQIDRYVEEMLAGNSNGRVLVKL